MYLILLYIVIELQASQDKRFRLQFNEDAAKLYDVKVVSKLYDDELERRLHEKK